MFYSTKWKKCGRIGYWQRETDNGSKIGNKIEDYEKSDSTNPLAYYGFEKLPNGQFKYYSVALTCNCYLRGGTVVFLNENLETSMWVPLIPPRKGRIYFVDGKIIRASNGKLLRKSDPDGNYYYPNGMRRDQWGGWHYPDLEWVIYPQGHYKHGKYYFDLAVSPETLITVGFDISKIDLNSCEFS